MPQRRSIKNIIVESLVFLALFASLGHMAVNFWEKFMIQSELVHMKTSLHSLKETISHIGAAYDSLHKELRSLIVVADKYPARLKYVQKPAQPLLPVPQLELKLDKTVKTNPSVAKHDKTTMKKDQTENKKLEVLVNTKSLNAAAVTGNPLKSAGDGNPIMDPIKKERRDTYSVNEPHNCLYSPEYKYCRRNQYNHNHPYHNWKV